MQILNVGIGLVTAYIIGALPIGFLIVKLITGKDVRAEHSGRTGGTNVMRVAGFWAGLATAAGDVLKGASAVWIGSWLSAGNVWVEVFCGALVIIGHNYSIFLSERVDGRWRLRGGAGGGSAVGVAIGLWAPSGLIIVPVAAAILFGIGYASVATLSIAVNSGIIFAVRAYLQLGPWEYVAFSAIALALLAYALRPNIQRLMAGTERLVGWRAKARDKKNSTIGELRG